LRQRKIKNRSKFPRTFNSDEIQSQWQGLREEYRIHQASKNAKVDVVKGDTTRFFSEICHLKPFAYDGTIGYSHPNGTHDDVFWSIALAVYATVEQSPEQFVTVIPR
jgi:hypothetical protein